ncbi:hypothetical protein AOCH_000175 [Aspergillus ochraceoroseus]|uniref:Fe2OG dioxygenase domain-containing protein n=1 Tax=Aspergillus ochraceoroseus TaxID=138278 RepID=A0A0F8VFQ5_9EURO|nr:hypothetical protein AOCH_000175 [Aspergillus ochraceoroseus]
MAKLIERLVPTISLKDYESRQAEIEAQLVAAAENTGFFSLVDHGITVEEIEGMFALSKRFFDLPKEVKAKTSYDVSTNNGWEYKAQVRASTGQADEKESLWMQRNSNWPSDEDVAGFHATLSSFIAKCEVISDRVLRCFSVALGFPEDFFKQAHDVTKPDCLTQFRFLHYPASTDAVGTWRAGTHTDIGCLTLLFQRDGEDGLEMCPGRESHHSMAAGDEFSPVPAKTGPILVNIGDMLMAWSDDRFKANFHRVRAKDAGFSPDRYSIAYFNTPRKDFILQGPLKKYPAMTVYEYFRSQVERQFGEKKAEVPAESIKTPISAAA